MSTGDSQLSTTGDMPPEIMERALINQDLSAMKPAERLTYYKAICDSLGLNPLTQPFAYIVLNGKTKLYALKDCTEHLRKLHSVSLQIVSREAMDDVYVVTARATLPSGRQDESVGAVTIKGTFGDAKANALMKAETKSKRRVTLSICGLGMLDETELETIPGSRVVSNQIPEDITAIKGRIAQHLESAKNAANENERKESDKKLAAKLRADGNIGDAARLDAHEEEPELEIDWRTVVCHIGRAEGPCLNKQVGEFKPKLLEWIKTQMEKGTAPTEKDTMLLWAVTEALKDWEKSRQAAREILEGKDAPEEEKGRDGAPCELTDPSRLPSAIYGTLAVPFDCSTKGKALHDLTEGQFRNLRPYCQGSEYVDWESEERTDVEREFRVGYNAIADQLGYFSTAKPKVKK